MTTLEVMAMNRAAYKRMCQRRFVYARLFVLLRDVLLILALMWCFASRAELARLISRACYSLVTRT